MSRLVALLGLTPAETRLLDGAGWGPCRVVDRPQPGDLREAEIVVAFSFADVPANVWEDAPRLRWIVSLPAGSNHVPFERLPRHATVLSIHGPNAAALAEHAFALLLAAAKRILPAGRALAAGEFDQRTLSKPLVGATLLVVGAGAIGGEVLRVGRAFGMRTIAARRSGHPHPEADETVADAAQAWARADYVVLALPLTRETRSIVDAAALAAMKRDAVLVNVARGGLVDREALDRHLEANPGFTYATDVWWKYPTENEPFGEPILRRANVIGTPHVGGVVPGWRENMVAAAAQALAQLAAGGEPARPARVEGPGRA